MFLCRDEIDGITREDHSKRKQKKRISCNGAEKKLKSNDPLAPPPRNIKSKERLPYFLRARNFSSSAPRNALLESNYTIFFSPGQRGRGGASASSAASSVRFGAIIRPLVLRREYTAAAAAAAAAAAGAKGGGREMHLARGGGREGRKLQSDI